MAIKQQISENVQDNSNKTTFAEVLNDLEPILDDLLHDNTDQAWVVQVSEQIVLNLANVITPRDPESIKVVQVDVTRVKKFFEQLSESKHQNSEIVARTCLKTLYKMLTSSDFEPSSVVASVLKVVENNYIKEACSWILSQMEYTSDDCIKLAINRMCIWVRGMVFAPLELWILEILEVLRVSKMTFAK